MRKTAILAGLLMFAWGQVYAQPRDGRWEGMNDRGHPISFLVANGGTEFQIQSLQQDYICPRGGEQRWGHGFGGFAAPIEEDQFEWLYGMDSPTKPEAGQGWVMLVAGTFLDDTHAEGVQEGWLATFSGRSLTARGGKLATQVCPTGDVPWTAEWVGEALAAPAAQVGQIHNPVRLR